jgi:hypothetical protein
MEYIFATNDVPVKGIAHGALSGHWYFHTITQCYTSVA